MTDEIIAFIRARLNDDEWVALAERLEWDVEWKDANYEASDEAERLVQRQIHTRNCGWRMGEGLESSCTCDVPARVLADIESKRKILDLCEFWLVESDHGVDPCAVAVIHEMAQPFAEHPAFKPEWKVS